MADIPGRGTHDGHNVWADLNNSNALQTRRFYLDAVDSLFARVSSGGTAAWYLPDRLGSIRNIVDSAGALLDTIAYDGFGVVTSESSPSNSDRYKWTGRELDSETGLQYNDARYFGLAVGRWRSQDPLGLGPDPNPYRYVRNDPANATDPTGNVYTYTLSRENRAITIHLRISFYGSRVTPFVIQKWVQGIRDEWDGPGKSRCFGKFTLTMAVEWEISKGYWSSKYHNIIEVRPAGWTKGGRPAYTYTWGLFNDTGDWARDITKWVAAHETGHLLGFMDRYTDLGTPDEGYEGTIMGELDGSASKAGPDGRSFRDRLIDDVESDWLNEKSRAE